MIFPILELILWLYQQLSRTIIQYIPRNMHTVFALLCFVVVIHWLIFPHPSGLLHWRCGNLTIAPVPAKQPWWIWINTSCEFMINDCITTTKQSTTKPCAYFLGYTDPVSCNQRRKHHKIWYQAFLHDIYYINFYDGTWSNSHYNIECTIFEEIFSSEKGTLLGHNVENVHCS